MTAVNILGISSVLSFLIKQTGISEAELARKINIPRATINRLVSGKTPDPRASTLNIIASYFNVSVDQLLGIKPLFMNQNNDLITNNHITIPILNWKDAKNSNDLVTTLKPDNHMEWISIDPSFDTAEFGLKLGGEAMWPLFQENTILVISTKKEVKNRDFVITHIKKTDEIIFRQLIIENQYKFLKALNNIFPTLPLESNDKIIGTVIQTRKNYI